MKTIKIYKYILFLFAITFVISCEVDDTELPEIITEEPNITSEISLDTFLANTFAQEADNQNLIDLQAIPAPTADEIEVVIELIRTQINNGTLTIPLSGDNQIAGYVISNDEGENFFEELIIQDKPSEPTIGVRIMLNESPLYTSYQIGRKIFIDTNNIDIELFIGLHDGVLAIGGPTEVDGGGNIEVGKISANLISDVIIRSATISTIVPKEITLADVNNENENIFVSLTDMQFPRNIVFGVTTATFASDDGDQFQGERKLVNCLTDEFIDLSTSTFASYITDILPNGQGTINGILARNFFDDKYIFKINSPTDIIFENGVDGRCDPPTLCDSVSGGGSVFYQENFESFSDYASEGWTNVNVSSGSTDWIVGEFNSNSYAQISGFGSDEDEIDVWLVTPVINMDTTTGEELQFEIQSNFDNGQILSVLYSSDFTGDVTTATWLPIDEIVMPIGPESGFGDFEAVGPTNISCLDGDINIAFFYEGSDPSATTRYHIDNIEITGN